MSSSRRALRAVAVAAVSLAFVAGTSNTSMAKAATAAQVCRSEKADVAQAKVRVAKAKKAKHDRAVKVQRAKKKLNRQRIQKVRACNRAKTEAQATNKAENRIAAFGLLLNNPILDALPAELRAPLLAALGDAITQLQSLTDQVPGAGNAELDAILAQLNALNPTDLQSAIEDLVAQLESAGGDPAALTGLLEGLLGGLPAGTALPDASSLDDLDGVLTALLAQLTAFDPTGGAAQLSALTDALAGLTGQLQGSSGDLTSLFDALSVLGGGSIPADPADFANLLGSVFGGGTELPFELPTDLEGVLALQDLLGTLSDLGGGASVPGLSDLIDPLLLILLGILIP